MNDRSRTDEEIAQRRSRRDDETGPVRADSARPGEHGLERGDGDGEESAGYGTHPYAHRPDQGEPGRETAQPVRDDDRDEMRVPSQRAAETRREAGDVLTASDAPTQPSPARPAVPAEFGGHGAELAGQDPGQLRERWREVQAAFVDEPRDAVERADRLTAEAVTALTGALERRTSELRERWQGAGQQDTERLRLALRDYRAVLERLMALSSRNAGDARDAGDPRSTRGAGDTAGDTSAAQGVRDSRRAAGTVRTADVPDSREGR